MPRNEATTTCKVHGEVLYIDWSCVDVGFIPTVIMYCNQWQPKNVHFVSLTLILL